MASKSGWPRAAGTDPATNTRVVSTIAATEAIALASRMPVVSTTDGGVRRNGRLVSDSMARALT